MRSTNQHRKANTSRQRTDKSRWCLARDYLPPLRFAVRLMEPNPK